MFKRFLALGLSVLFSTLAVEGALRLIYEVPPDWIEPQTRHVVDADLGWILPVNDDSYTIDAPVRTNSLGLRDDEIPFEKPPGEVRILSLGDSFTFALGVRFEDLYVQKLERQLEKLDASRRFQVINAGVAGYNTTQELSFLIADGFRYEPDLITLGFYWNDLIGNEKPLPIVEGPIRRGGPDARREDQQGHMLPAWIRNPMRRSLILYLGVTRTKNLMAALSPPTDEVSLVQRAILDGDAEAMSRHWSATGARLVQLAAEARRRGIPVLLISFPMENQIRQSQPASAYIDALRRAWEPTGNPMIDLAPLYRDSLAEGRNPYLPYDLHPGPLGMQIAADAIEAEIRRQGLLVPPPDPRTEQVAPR